MNNKAKVSPTVTEQFNATSVTKGYTYCREIKCTVNNTTVQYNILFSFSPEPYSTGGHQQPIAESANIDTSPLYQQQ